MAQKIFCIKLPQHVLNLLDSELQQLSPSHPLNCKVKSEMILVSLAEHEFQAFTTTNIDLVFTLHNFRLMNNTIVCSLSYPMWTGMVTILTLPPHLSFPDSSLNFSQISARATTFQINSGSKSYQFDKDIGRYLDASLNYIDLSKITTPVTPSTESQGVVSSPETAAAQGSLKTSLQDIKGNFQDILWEPGVLGEKLRQNKAMNNRDAILTTLALNGLIGIDK